MNGIGAIATSDTGTNVSGRRCVLGHDGNLARLSAEAEIMPVGVSRRGEIPAALSALSTVSRVRSFDP